MCGTGDRPGRVQRCCPVSRGSQGGAPDDGDLHFFEVLIHDEDRHTLVLQDSNGDFFVIKYDRNDRFYYDGVREHLKTFAEGLGERELVEMRIQSHHPNLVNRFERF